MKNGDISNAQLPRAVFVWENCLAILPDKDKGREARYLKHHRWEKAFNLWGHEPEMRKLLKDMTWRRFIPVDILTTHPQGYARYLEDWLDVTNYPFNRLIHEPAGLVAFSDQLAFWPEVSVVYHSESRQPFLFGSKGCCVIGASSVG